MVVVAMTKEPKSTKIKPKSTKTKTNSTKIKPKPILQSQLQSQPQPQSNLLQSQSNLLQSQSSQIRSNQIKSDQPLRSLQTTNHKRQTINHLHKHVFPYFETLSTFDQSSSLEADLSLLSLAGLDSESSSTSTLTTAQQVQTLDYHHFTTASDQSSVHQTNVLQNCALHCNSDSHYSHILFCYGQSVWTRE